MVTKNEFLISVYANLHVYYAKYLMFEAVVIFSVFNSSILFYCYLFYIIFQCVLISNYCLLIYTILTWCYAK